ncbi:hypothetical protein HLB23_15525 [Nocardia uniformis]|uniref:Uncharacterized protein n=1 Tax=Nocardia uniformis TaxID=53432 RepID=A0A849BY99_9NOCA|nr:hypothetical protein [Nocardia uniformis]NNH71254.1 hypothetical protein [Nocardia uniformis]
MRINIAAVLGLVVATSVALSELVWQWGPAWFHQASTGLIVLGCIVGLLVPAGLWLRDDRAGGPPIGMIGMYLGGAGMVGFIVVSQIRLSEPWQSTASMASTGMFFIGMAIVAINEAGKQPGADTESVGAQIMSLLLRKLRAEARPLDRSLPLNAPVGTHLATLAQRTDTVFQLFPPR